MRWYVGCVAPLRVTMRSLSVVTKSNVCVRCTSVLPVMTARLSHSVPFQYSTS